MAIYFVQAGEGGPVKIGFAQDIKLRMNKMRSDNHETLRLVAAFVGGVDDERALHNGVRSAPNGAPADEWEPCPTGGAHRNRLAEDDFTSRLKDRLAPLAIAVCTKGMRISGGIARWLRHIGKRPMPDILHLILFQVMVGFYALAQLFFQATYALNSFRIRRLHRRISGLCVDHTHARFIELVEDFAGPVPQKLTVADVDQRLHKLRCVLEGREPAGNGSQVSHGTPPAVAGETVAHGKVP